MQPEFHHWLLTGDSRQPPAERLQVLLVVTEVFRGRLAKLVLVVLAHGSGVLRGRERIEELATDHPLAEGTPFGGPSRRLFDIGADPAVIGEHLGVDPLLGQALARHPGIRTPGAWDGFELAVRAVLGQQVSVRAATTIAGRLASMFGSPLLDGGGL